MKTIDDPLEVGDLIIYGEHMDAVIATWRMFAQVIMVDDSEGVIIKDIKLISKKPYEVPLVDFTKLQDYHLIFHNFGKAPLDNIFEEYPEYFI